jgi:hypothetical protein
MNHRWQVFLGMVAIAVGLTAAPTAFASPMVVLTACDTLTVAGRSCIRIAFSVHNPSTEFDILAFFATPKAYQVANDTCSVLQQVAPAGWGMGSNGGGGVEWGTNPDGPPPIRPGETLAGFGMLLNRPTCCYEVEGMDPVFDVAGFETDCWSCPLATPTREATWGRVKAIYRSERGVL